MNKPLTPIQKLDEVLHCLAQDRGHSSDADIIKLVKRVSGTEYPSDKMNQILGKLCKDGYVGFEDRFSTSDQRQIRRYWITFEGDFFANQGGLPPAGFGS